LADLRNEPRDARDRPTGRNLVAPLFFVRSAIVGATVAPSGRVRVHNEDLASAVDAASAIAREAGALVLEGWRTASSVRTKSDRSDLVTEYDERSERLIRDRLAKALPSHGVVGEEAQGAQQSDRELVWYVDPIDGTTNFAHGHPFFCIALGLVERDSAGAEQPIAGVVVAPALSLEWRGARGLGALRNGIACRVSSTRRLDEALLGSGFPAARARTSDNNYAPFLAVDAASHGVRRCGSAAMELCLVADGGYDAFWDIGLKAWDVAAAIAIVREAGGRASDLAGDAAEIHAGRILLSNGLVHDELLAAIGGSVPLPTLGERSPRPLRPHGAVG
jgi:myo-inositol-1(or 4)-monophosphatase